MSRAAWPPGKSAAHPKAVRYNARTAADRSASAVPSGGSPGTAPGIVQSRAPDHRVHGGLSPSRLRSSRVGSAGSPESTVPPTTGVPG